MDETDFEMHIPTMRFCGPFTNLEKRLDCNDKPKPGSEPIDRVDEAALRHDLYYNTHPKMKDRIISDEVLIHELRSINNPTLKERIERAIAIFCLRVKIIFVRCCLWIIGLRNEE